MNWLALTRAAFGAAVLLAPDEVAGHIGDRRLSRGTRNAMRILGVRLLFEAAVCYPRPTRCLLRCEAAVDVIHGASMTGVALVTRNDSRRRAAAANVVTATAFTVADAVSVRRSGYGGVNRIDGGRALQLRDAVAERVCRLLPPGRTQ